ncbi:hypothetical protein ACTZWT_22825 [Rhodopseudomonas sp. NSM]|uniref:hypothetical protein n=1 Tax=Rhodopseudomonas sp. NSM TaxID=3457630 RepID=UPI0040350362
MAALEATCAVASSDIKVTHDASIAAAKRDRATVLPQRRIIPDLVIYQFSEDAIGVAAVWPPDFAIVAEN